MWVRLNDEILDNPKILAVGALGFQLYVAGLIYAGRNLTDGFIPAGKTGTLVDLSGVYVARGNDPGVPNVNGRRTPHVRVNPPNPRAIAGALVHAGLWRRVRGGFRVHDYLAYNPSRAEVLAQRAGAAERQRRRRARTGEVTEDVTRDSQVRHGPPVPVPVPLKNRALETKQNKTKQDAPVAFSEPQAEGRS